MRTVKAVGRSAAIAATAAVVMVLNVPGAHAAVALTQIIVDPFTNTTSQHQATVEPDTFAFGDTIVTVTQSGRFFDGGGSDIGYATSTNGGASWTQGVLPGITPYNGGGARSSG